ncbi:hypothetical protein OAL14_00345 [Gammaproteobacteria bacterium]|nr:hypothetical protein [Gammaproteobacteria bacterium]
MKTIVYELNEVPKKLFDFYANSFPHSSFAFLKNNADLFETFTADIGSLSPWVTWPTMHRGVSNVEHEISDLGQDLQHVNQEYPPIWEMLARMGVRVGVFGSLQSYPIPTNLENYDFYVPDTFAAGSECFPEKLTSFQAFNLSMVKASGRNVSPSISISQGASFAANSLSLGLSWKTLTKIALQLSQERINKDLLVRRRSTQIEIAFDLFFAQLKKATPDVSFFFTNHLASSMHRYWPTIFPEDYDEGRFDGEWLSRWKSEIPHALKVANYQIATLTKFCQRYNYKLIIASSMGQGAVQNSEPISKQVLITNIGKLLEKLGVEKTDWSPRLSMAPQVVVKPKSADFLTKISKLEGIQINGKPIKYFVSSTGDVRFEVKLMNAKSVEVRFNERIVDLNELGLSNVDIQDAAGANAYHIPEGILLKYDPRESWKKKESAWDAISVLDFAPSMMNHFGFKTASYMRGEVSLSSN